MTPKQKIAAARLTICRNTPYFATQVLMLSPREAPGLGTFAVTKTGIMLVDYEYVEGLTVAQVAGVIAHEMLHPFLQHHTRFSDRDHKLGNLAGDLCINPMVLDMRYELPPGGILPEMFGWPRGETADFYYRKLEEVREKHQQTCPACKAAQQGKGQPQPGDGDADGSKGDKQDAKGSGKGKKKDKPDKGEGHNGKGDCPFSGEKPECGKGWCGSGGGHAVEGEPGDGDPDGRSEVELARVRRMTAESIRTAASSNRGSVPEGLLRLAEALLTPPQVRWQDKLANLARASIATAAGMKDYSYARPNRRSAFGGPGDPIRPTLRRPVPKVTVAVDTSGSMGTNELEQALPELRGVLLAVGAAVDFIACDAAVHEHRKIAKWQDALKLLKGGGGTDFKPIFDAVSKRGRDKSDVLVIVTDGCGPAPAAPPHGMGVIWLLVGGYKRKPYVEGPGNPEVQYGDVIELG